MPFDIRADLPALKTELQTKIDAEAGRVRALFITVTAGQEMVYMAKQSEARLIATDPEQGANVPDSDTPHVSAEAAADQVSRYDKAMQILGVAQLWADISPIIETKRLTAKSEVAAATSVHLARAAANVDWSDITDIANG